MLPNSSQNETNSRQRALEKVELHANVKAYGHIIIYHVLETQSLRRESPVLSKTLREIGSTPLSAFLSQKACKISKNEFQVRPRRDRKPTKTIENQPKATFVGKIRPRGHTRTSPGSPFEVNTFPEPSK